MAEERIDLIKKVYSKTEYPKIIDTKFRQLGNISLPEQLDDTFTVEVREFSKESGVIEMNLDFKLNNWNKALMNNGL